MYVAASSSSKDGAALSVEFEPAEKFIKPRVWATNLSRGAAEPCKSSLGSIWERRGVGGPSIFGLFIFDLALQLFFGLFELKLPLRVCRLDLPNRILLFGTLRLTLVYCGNARLD